MLFNFTKDAKSSKGEPFWVGGKRAPKPLTFDINNVNHFEFVVGAANLRAFVYGIEGDALGASSDKALYKSVIDTVAIPEFVPKYDL